MQHIFDYNSIIDEINSNEINLSSFIPKDSLNSMIWNNGKLNYRVRLKLIDIAYDFMEDSKLNTDLISDIIITGSLANYNWSKYSDIDLHIIIDLKKISDDIDLSKEYVDSKKKIWNDTHTNLSIYGFPVEIYIQDESEKHTSSGVYSILRNKWLIKPSKEHPYIDKEKIKQKSASLINRIDNLYLELSRHGNNAKIGEEANKLYKKIKKMRKSGLETGGEFSVENIVFKVLRRTEYISKLIELRNITYDRLNSLK